MSVWSLVPLRRTRRARQWASLALYSPQSKSFCLRERERKRRRAQTLQLPLRQHPSVLWVTGERFSFGHQGQRCDSVGSLLFTPFGGQGDAFHVASHVASSSALCPGHSPHPILLLATGGAGHIFFRSRLMAGAINEIPDWPVSTEQTSGFRKTICRCD